MPKLLRGSAAILMIGIISAIILSAGAFYLLKKPTSPTASNPVVQSQPTPTPAPADETLYTEDSRSANWKTYTNTSDHFTIKYPSEWRIESIGNTATFGPGITGVTEQQNSRMTIQTEVPNPSTGIIDATTYKDKVIEAQDIDRVTAILIDGVNGFKLELNNFGTKQEMIVFDRDNVIYYIVFGQAGKPEISGTDKKTYEQILSTFKFTN